VNDLQVLSFGIDSDEFIALSSKFGPVDSALALNVLHNALHLILGQIHVFA